MKIFFSENEFETSNKEDLRLKKKFEIEHTVLELEEIVNTIVEHKDVPSDNVISLLSLMGYELVSMSDLDYTMMWLKQLSSQYSWDVL